MASHLIGGECKISIGSECTTTNLYPCSSQPCDDMKLSSQKPAPPPVTCQSVNHPLCSSPTRQHCISSGNPRHSPEVNWSLLPSKDVSTGIVASTQTTEETLSHLHYNAADSVLPKEFRHRLNKFFIHIEREFEREYRKLYAENLALQERLEKYEEAGEHSDGKIFQRKFGGGIQISQRLKQQYKERTSRVLSRLQQVSSGANVPTADFTSHFNLNGNQNLPPAAAMSALLQSSVSHTHPPNYAIPPLFRPQPRWCARFTGHRDGVWEVTAGRKSSSHLLASASADSSVRLWNVDTGSLLLIYVGHRNASVNSVRFHDDLLLTAGGDGRAHLLRLSQYECLTDWLVSGVSGTTKTDDLNVLSDEFPNCNNNPVGIFSSGEIPESEQYRLDSVGNNDCIVNSGTIKRKASAEDQLTDSNILLRSNIHSAPISVPEDSSIATPTGAISGIDGGSNVFGWNNTDNLPFLDEHNFTSSNLPIAGTNCVVESENIPVIRQPVTTFQDFSTQSPDNGPGSAHSILLPLSAADFLVNTSSSIQVVTGSWDRVARIYDINSGGQQVSHLTGHDQGITDVRCSSHGSARVLTAAKDGTFRLWDFRKGGQHEVIVQQCHHHIVSSAQFVDEQGDRLLTAGSTDRTCKLWDLRSTRSPLYSLRLDSPINRFSISLQTGVVALPLDNRNIKLMDVSTGHRIGRLPRSSSQGHTRMVTSVAWLEDVLATASSRPNIFTSSFDHNICSWNVPFQH